MHELRLFYFEIDLEPTKCFLITAEYEDDAYKKLEEYAKGLSKYVCGVLEVGYWEEIKEKLNKEKAVEIF